MGSWGRASGVVVAVAVALVLLGWILPSAVLPVQANTGCPAASNSFGSQTWLSSCTIDSDTTWGNGTLTIAGSLTVNSGAALVLWNMIIRFSSTSDLQRTFAVSGFLLMEYGTLQSNDSYHWSMTSGGASARVVVDHANITGAGSGSTFGIVVTGGGKNRFAHDTILGVNMKVLGESGDYVGYSNISQYDDSVLNQHVVWMGANSTFEHNTMWDITLGTQSAVTNYETFGNATFFANTLYLRAAGSNAMGFEIINEQAASIPIIYQGPWVARLTWNNVTFTYVGGGTNSNGFDNEFSERVYMARNTVTNLGSNPVTECLEGGGLNHALAEFNTCRGNAGGFAFGIYDYIYEGAQNVFQYNTFDRASVGAIVQAGGNTFAHNTFTNLTSEAFFICPNSPCAGSTANTSNNAWYNNTVTFASGSDLTRMSLSNAFYNIVMGHGARTWTDGGTEHAVYGDWLFFANGPIQSLQLADRPDGHRTLYMTTGGQAYWDQEPGPGIADSASLSVTGSLDATGSVQGGTVFWSLDPYGTTSVNVTGTGQIRFDLAQFEPSYTYNLSIENLGTHSVQNGVVSTDSTGAANFSVDFGSTQSSYAFIIVGSVPSPPRDTTPPAQVADLRLAVVGENFTVLEWTAPGGNGTVGRASAYDLRYSTFGPPVNETFALGTTVPTPLPGPSGSTESVNVTGLQPAGDYWFAVRTADEVPNWSPISNVAHVTTLRTPPPNGSSPAPQVLSASLNGTAPSIDVAFSRPMDRSSVTAALQVSPTVAYHLDWIDDSHVRIVFDTPLEPSIGYSLAIETTAVDQAGTPLASTYLYLFERPPSTTPTPTDSTGALAATAVITAAIVALALWIHVLPRWTRFSAVKWKTWFRRRRQG
jgi:hypothetical protein